MGALAAGATEILVKDAHLHGRNLDPAALRAPARLHRGWSGHPYAMMDGLDESFAAAILIGYHAPAGSTGNPLAHTLSLNLQRLRINGELASEFTVSGLTAAWLGVPSSRAWRAATNTSWSTAATTGSTPCA